MRPAPNSTGVPRRAKRPGEVICRCGAYGFPHRFMGGLCDGAAYVSEVWEKQQWGGCRGCVFYAQRGPEEWDDGYGLHTCQVLLGQEEVRECPELADHIHYEGVRLYGVNKPPLKRMGWRR